MHQRPPPYVQGLSCAELEATLLWLTRDAPDALLPLLTALEQAGGAGEQMRVVSDARKAAEAAAAEAAAKAKAAQAKSSKSSAALKEVSVGW